MSPENQIPELDMPEKYVKIIKGKELNIRLADEITSTRSLFYPAFQQAQKALCMIVKQTRTFYEDEKYKCLLEGYDDDCLSLYNGSIIAFEAQRGYGKTQTMLSFSHWMENLHVPFVQGCRHRGCGEQPPYGCDHRKASTCYDADEKDACTNMPLFVVLPMIAPSAFEEKQNLLYVVLSRLYNHAQDLARERIMSEEKRMELSRILQKCLSGINGFKKLDCQSSYDDFSSLQDVCDGLALRKHFWELLYFLAKEEAGPRDTFFVIQLDDVDSQIKSGYQVLDDIRKYLIIPNLVILMSTDEDLLFRAIQEEHLKQFEALNNIDLNMPSLVAKISKKYINKLIPPSHMVHLPRLEQYMDSSKTRLNLFYLKSDLNIDNITIQMLEKASIFPWQRENLYEAQDTIFHLIFRKTGIAFARHHNYMHNIIPRSMRGLSQLFFFLSELEDIPTFEELDFQSEYAYISKWIKRIKITETNLTFFMNYFTNEWLDVKAAHFSKNRNDRKFLRDLVSAPKENRIIMTINYLQNIFVESLFPNERASFYEDLIAEYEKQRSIQDNDTHNINTRDKDLSDKREKELPDEENDKIDKIRIKLVETKQEKPSFTVLMLNKYMIELSESHKENEDYLLFFSIHVLLNTLSHIMLVQEKKHTINLYLQEKKECKKNGFSTFLVFPINTLNVGLPKTFPVKKTGFVDIQDESKPIGGIITELTQKEKEDIFQSYSSNTYKTIIDCFSSSEENADFYLLNVLNFPALLLNLGELFNKEVKITIDKSRSEEQIMEANLASQISMQKSLFIMQEIASFILCNWDVQEKIYKYLSKSLRVILQDQIYGEYYYNFFRRGHIDLYIYENIYEYIFAGVDRILNTSFKSHWEYLFPRSCFSIDEKGAPNVGLSYAFHALLNQTNLSNMLFGSRFAELFDNLFIKRNKSYLDNQIIWNIKQSRKNINRSKPPQQSDTNKES